MPTVSVIIPTYNRAELLKEAVQSVLDQTYSDYEIIIADDGSTDNTREVVAAFNSDKIKYKSLEHGGRSRARNEALKLAQGRYIAFLDSDDIFLPNKLEFQVTCLENEPEIGMVCSSAYNINEQGKLFDWHYRAPANGLIYHKIVFYYPFVMIPSTVMLRAEILTEIGGFDENLERYEDIDFCRRVAKRYPIQSIYQPLIKFRTHSGNIMEVQNPEKILEYLHFYIDKVFREDSDMGRYTLRKLAARFCWGYGKAVSEVPEFRNVARRFYFKAIKYWPFSLGAYVFLIEFYLPKFIYKPLYRFAQTYWYATRELN